MQFYHRLKKMACTSYAALQTAIPHIWLLLWIFLGINTLTRFGLLLFNQDYQLLLPQYSVPIFAVGLLYDLSVYIYWLIPIALFASLLLLITQTKPPQTPKITKTPKSMLFLRKFINGLAYYAQYVLAFALIINWLFIALSEFTFWNEFNTRFNFIAVDYLIYTSEVIGNIRESYNVPVLLGGVFALSAIVFYVYLTQAKKCFKQYTHSTHTSDSSNPDSAKISRLKKGMYLIGLMFVLPMVNYFAMSANFKEFSPNREANQLASNGQFEFGHAFFANELDYAQFYPVLPDNKVQEILSATPAAALSNQSNQLKTQVEQRNATTSKTSTNSQNPIHLQTTTRPNIVLVSIESLSADFLGSFGNKENLTPHLDQMAKEGILFKQIYATGTRTVRGLEALSLSIPPTPGHSIVKRNDNQNLNTLGYILGNNNYKSLYIYGGYSAFDNMYPYFHNNSYEVIDRMKIDAKDIHYENVWGVADEDLFTLALKQFDEQTSQKTPNQANQPFFAHIMTTSNHRPFTYPEGRVDVPSKTNRQGAVKYTDWAINDFIQRAKLKPWFKNTIFLFVADHCASARGKTDLPIDKFLIPLIIYAPELAKTEPILAPRLMEQISSQIDIAPSILELLNIQAKPTFFGQNLFSPNFMPRAFMANYQTVGMYINGKMVELRPQQQWRMLNAQTNEVLEKGTFNAKKDNVNALPNEVQQAIAYYQTASHLYKSGALAAAPH